MEKRQSHFGRLIKWIYNPRGHGPDALRSLFVINPILIGMIVVVTNGSGSKFWQHYFYSLLIGQGVALTCILTAKSLSFFGVRLLGIQIQRRTFIMASASAMVPGLWFGFKLADAVVLSNDPSRHSFSDYSSGLMIGALFLGIFSLADMWIAAQKHTSELENENLQAKLSALSAQMNPHLLFNALNTIASTIPSNPAAAEETTLKLSELYRGILASSKRASHPLSLELEICRAYLGIESSRFGDRLKWSIESDPALENLEVPTLLIQPLVENAIKHGISQHAQGGKVHLQISRQDGRVSIQVIDDGIGFGNSRSTQGTGTGVSSCKARLELLYRGKASFEIGTCHDGNGTRVQISFPEKMETLT
jgi:signal transduction histidine kinase